MMFLFLRRFLARVFDYGFFYFIAIFTSLILPFDLEKEQLLLGTLLAPLIWAPIEAVLLKRYGTTPGKKLFGLSLPPLTWTESFKRAFFVKRSHDFIARKIGIKRYIISLMLTCSAASALFFGEGISEVAIQYEQQVAGSGWVQYVSDDGKFQVHFPKKPEQATQSFDVPNGEPLNLSEFKAHKEAEFSVSYVDLPKKWKLFSSNTLLKGAMKVVMEHKPGTQLVEKKFVKHKSYPAMDFKMKDGDNLIEGRLILVGNTLYKLWVVYFPDTPREGQHQTFLSSFELKE